MKIFCRKAILLVLLSVSFMGLSAQSFNADSLRARISAATSDTARINALNAMAGAYIESFNVDSASLYSEAAAAASEKAGFKKGLAYSSELKARILDAKSDFDGALKEFDHSLELFTELNDKKMIALVHQGIANAWYSRGITDKALKYYMLSLREREELADSSGISNSLMGVSIVYNDMRRNDLALGFALKALGIKQRLHETRYVSWLLNNIGLTYLAMKDTVNALKYYNQSLAIKKEIGDEYGIATTLKNIGGILVGRKNYAEALVDYHTSYQIRHRINPDDSHNLARALADIGALHLEMKNYDSAYYYTDRAIQLGRKANSYDVLSTPYYNMARILSGMGKYQEALKYMDLHLVARDSILNMQTNQLMTDMASKYDSEKKEQQLAMQDSEIRSQKRFQFYLAGFALLILILALVLLSGYRNKKRANELLNEKNAVIHQQKMIVEEKNKDITDSIHYAKRIQRAILPSKETVRKLLPQSFIFFRPKDIVSGDFYWVEKVKGQTVVACIDCTGHGVPGAFMTFMAYSLLNEAVLEHGVESPALILQEMRVNLNKMLRQKNDALALRDGMDISLCMIDQEKKLLQFAGAYNPLWLIRSGSVSEVKADKQPIGVFDGTESPFTNHSLTLEAGDALYLFTDGYADQFGGPRGKKFKYRPLQDLLLKISSYAPDEQEKILADSFDGWRAGNGGAPLSQVDDVCIIGIKI